MKCKQALWVGVFLGLIIAGTVLISAGQAFAAVQPILIEAAPKPTEPVMTQPLPPAAEPGANMPLVCGGIVLLVIILGGVFWNLRLKKTGRTDH